MCTTIRFLGWAPGSRVPSQSPTIVPFAALSGTVGVMLNPSTSRICRHSPSEDERVLFIVARIQFECHPYRLNKDCREVSSIRLLAANQWVKSRALMYAGF